MTNQTIDSIAADMSALISENVEVGIINPRDLATMDDVPAFRIGIALNSRNQNVRNSSDVIIESETLRVQIFDGRLVLKNDFDNVTDRINDVVDKLYNWYKARFGNPRAADGSIHRIEYLGRRDPIKSAAYIEQSVDFKISRII